MDLTSVTLVMQAFTAAMGAAKNLGDSSLQKQLADGMAEAAKVVQENAELRTEVADLKARLAVRDELEWDPTINAYRKKAATDGVIYCPKCGPQDYKAVPMRNRGRDWQCYVCGTVARGAGTYHEQPDDFEPPREPIR